MATTAPATAPHTVTVKDAPSDRTEAIVEALVAHGAIAPTTTAVDRTIAVVASLGALPIVSPSRGRFATLAHAVWRAAGRFCAVTVVPVFDTEDPFARVYDAEDTYGESTYLDQLSAMLPDNAPVPPIAEAVPSDGLRRPLGAGTALMVRVRRALNDAQLVRVSGYNGGELTGVTESFGSTGFSVRIVDDATLSFNVVVSGRRCGVSYHEYTERDGDGESREMTAPENADILHPRVRAAFARLGFAVRSVRTTGWQLHWDDDIDFTVETDYPPLLGRYTPSRRPTMGGFRRGW